MRELIQERNYNNMPNPNKGEQREDFLARCISSEESKKTFPDQQQRIAFCYSQWRKAHPGDKETKKNECS